MRMGNARDSGGCRQAICTSDDFDFRVSSQDAGHGVVDGIDLGIYHLAAVRSKVDCVRLGETKRSEKKNTN